MNDTMNLWERNAKARLRREVTISERQCGFMRRSSTTDAMFVLMEKYREGWKELHCVFVALEKVYDRVSREELCVCEGGAGDEDSRDSGEVCGKSER